jgi:hypothetical protein
MDNNRWAGCTPLHEESQEIILRINTSGRLEGALILKIGDR